MASPLDSLFAELQRFAEQRALVRRWIACAKGTSAQSWRLTFLRQARSAYAGAERHLGVVVAEVGRPADDAASTDPRVDPAPLEVLGKRLALLHAELASDARRLAALEAECLTYDGPRFTA
jgi:hypothetical protein